MSLKLIRYNRTSDIVCVYLEVETARYDSLPTFPF